MTREQRIKQVFCNVDLSEKGEVLQASENLEDIPGAEVISWLTEASKKWHYSELLYGVKNIEEVFGAEFDSKRLVELYFEEPDFWFGLEDQEILKEFGQIIGRDIDIDKIVELIDMDFVRKSITFDVGILGFIQFIHTNEGDTKPFIKRAISIADKLNQQEIAEIICMADYIDIDDADAEKLFQYVDWDEVGEDKDEYIFFFKKFAPNLTPQIA